MQWRLYFLGDQQRNMDSNVFNYDPIGYDTFNIFPCPGSKYSYLSNKTLDDFKVEVYNNVYSSTTVTYNTTYYFELGK